MQQKPLAQPHRRAGIRDVARGGNGIAGLADDADPPLSADQLAWAKLILVMGASHRRRLMQRYGPSVKGKRIVVLDIRDDYDFMQPALIELFLRKADPFLR